MSTFPRIHPDHPLTKAARIVNEHAEEHGLEKTIEWLGMNANAGEIAYLGEQRALRAIAAAMFGVNLGATANDEYFVSEIVATPLWKDMQALLIACYMDGFAIGWAAHEIAEGERNADA